MPFRSIDRAAKYIVNNTHCFVQVVCVGRTVSKQSTVNKANESVRSGVDKSMRGGVGRGVSSGLDRGVNSGVDRSGMGRGVNSGVDRSARSGVGKSMSSGSKVHLQTNSNNCMETVYPGT